MWTAMFSSMLQLGMNLKLQNDEVTYFDAAKLLVTDHTIDNTRPILISAIFGIPFLFGCTDAVAIQFGLVVNYVSWIFTIVLIFKILCSFLTRKKSFFWTFPFIFFIGNLAHTFVLLSESIFIFFITLSIYFLSKYFKTNHLKYIIFAISILLINSLIKPVSIGLALILLSVFAMQIFKILKSNYSILIFGSLSVVVLQMFAVKNTYGDFTISYISSFTYYNYLGAKADCLKKNIAFIPGENVRTKQFNLLSSHDMKKLAAEDFINQLQNNKLNLFKAYLFGIYSNSSKGNLIVSNCKNDNNAAYFDAYRFLFKAISKLQTIFFTVIAVFIACFTIVKYGKKRLFFSIVAVFVLYIFLVSAISSFECDRFHITFYPLMIILLNNLNYPFQKQQ